MKNLSFTGWLALLLPFYIFGLTQFSFASSLRDEKRDVSGFSRIESSGSFQVEIRSGNRESLRLEGPSEVLEQVETIVENGTLKIRMKRNAKNFFNMRSNTGVKVFIEAKNLTGLSLSGSGTIQSAVTLKGSDVDIKVSGSGSISSAAETEELSVQVSGSGRVDARGKAKEAEISISGSGRMNALELAVDESEIRISGSGRVELTANNSIDARISGSGSVRYKGSASNINAQTSGSGKVTRI